jgi:hypothetical protein
MRLLPLLRWIRLLRQAQPQGRRREMNTKNFLAAIEAPPETKANNALKGQIIHSHASRRFGPITTDVKKPSQNDWVFL